MGNTPRTSRVRIKFGKRYTLTEEFPDAILEKAWDRQGGQCARCGKLLVWVNRKPGSMARGMLITVRQAERKVVRPSGTVFYSVLAHRKNVITGSAMTELTNQLNPFQTAIFRG